MDRSAVLLSYWEEQHHTNNFNNHTTASNSVKFESLALGEDRNQLQTSCKEEEEEESVFSNLNFTTVFPEGEDFGYQKKKALARDPMSHRIIEKRRRDRMNNCLADLSRLIPAEYLKKGRGRVEKTEIIEMAIKHMIHLQGLASGHSSTSSSHPQDSSEEVKVQHTGSVEGVCGGIVVEHYRTGYQECLAETMHHLVEVEGYYAGEPLCVNLISHLQKHCDKLTQGDRLSQLRCQRSGESCSGSSLGYRGGPGSTSSGSDSGGHSTKENQPGPADWRQSEAEEPPSPVPLPPTLHNLPPPPPAPLSCEQDDNSLLSLASSELGDPAASSQLRQMLTGNHQSRGQLSTSSGSDDTGALYKFKNNIKQRFSAEHHHEKRRRIDINNLVIKRRDSMDSPPPLELSLIKQRHESASLPVDNTDPQSSSSNCCTNSLQQQNFGVPVFALHSKGSYYVPLTLDNEVLSPYLASFNQHNPILHPVTISVNFCGVGSSQQQSAVPMVPWRGGEPPSLMPLAKWPISDTV